MGLYSPFCVGPGRKLGRQVFSCENLAKFNLVTNPEDCFYARSHSINLENLYMYNVLLS